ncbi:hypothetical protein Adi01nite_72290 [Amorphoplanes digitatis]|nr:hypothetical protein Adi01nite_72290 [Actinoplanes digitatis]
MCPEAFSAVAAFIGAVVLLILGLLGLRHARRMKQAAPTQPAATGDAPTGLTGETPAAETPPA